MKKKVAKKDSSSSTVINIERDVTFCGVCREEVKEDHEALQCEFCSLWYHIKCEKVPKAVYILLLISIVISIVIVN